MKKTRKSNASGPWRPFQNVSSEEMYWPAVRKLAKNLVVLLILTAIYRYFIVTAVWPDYSDEVGFLIKRAMLWLLVFLWWKLFVRELVMGFFACSDCRRLKTAPHLSPVIILHEGDCQDCSCSQERARDASVATLSSPVTPPFARNDPTRKKPTVHRITPAPIPRPQGSC